ncbi:hypothetical protein V8E53_003393, partial [Lactarius tabidus]
YKSRGSFMGTYNTALTHAFDKAQTKTIHTPTEDSYAWVLSMADPFALTLLPHAFQTYTTLSHQTATGRGMRPDAGERAALSEDCHTRQAGS